MKIIAAVLCVTVARVVTLRIDNASKSIVRANADLAEQLVYGDPDYIEMLGWMGPEAMDIIEKQVAGHMVALSTRLQTMERLFGSTQRNASFPLELSSICEHFLLNTQECERVEAYLGRLGHNRTRTTVVVQNYSEGTIRGKGVTAIGVCEMCEASAKRFSDLYKHDFCGLLDGLYGSRVSGFWAKRKALFKFGDFRDEHTCFPTIYKTRLMSHRDDNYVLLDLNHAWHWGAVGEVPRADVAWALKTAKLVWRGGSTGECDATKNNTRMMLTSKWSRSSDQRVDVGFSSVVQHCTAAVPYVKASMGMQEMLKAKYVLVAQGNDKASGLNWALASNSAPFMVEPEVESWLLESSLKAWEHYIPVKPDFSDLSSQIDWAVKHDGEARRIGENGRDYMRRFKSAQTEANIQAAVLATYLDRMYIRAALAGEDGNEPLEGHCSESS